MYEKLRTQNKIIQLLQNLVLTVSTGVLILETLLFSGLIGGLWENISKRNGPVDDVEGYAMIVQVIKREKLSQI